MIAPILAVVGGGQLARMMQEEASALGIHLRALVEAADGSTGQVVVDAPVGAADDEAAVRAVTAGDGTQGPGGEPVAVLTFEHEHQDSSLLERLQDEGVSVQPTPQALELARDCDIYIILRGTYSALCTPTGTAFFDTTGNTGLQTQGASNVLVGVVAGLLGQGYQSITAAVLGLHLVGLSAELYAGRYSERSLTATSLIDLLGEAYHQLEAR